MYASWKVEIPYPIVETNLQTRSAWVKIIGKEVFTFEQILSLRGYEKYRLSIYLSQTCVKGFEPGAYVERIGGTNLAKSTVIDERSEARLAKSLLAWEIPSAS